MSLKISSYLQRWRPIRPAKQNHLCTFGRGHYEKYFCKIIVNLDPLFRRRYRLKKLGIYSSNTEHDYLRNFGRDHYGYISMKLFKIWNRRSGEVI